MPKSSRLFTLPQFSRHYLYFHQHSPSQEKHLVRSKNLTKKIHFFPSLFVSMPGCGERFALGSWTKADDPGKTSRRGQKCGSLGRSPQFPLRDCLSSRLLCFSFSVSGQKVSKGRRPSFQRNCRCIKKKAVKSQLGFHNFKRISSSLFIPSVRRRGQGRER